MRRTKCKGIQVHPSARTAAPSKMKDLAGSSRSTSKRLVISQTPPENEYGDLEDVHSLAAHPPLSQTPDTTQEPMTIPNPLIEIIETEEKTQRFDRIERDIKELRARTSSIYEMMLKTNKILERIIRNSSGGMDPVFLSQRQNVPDDSDHPQSEATHIGPSISTGFRSEASMSGSESIPIGLDIYGSRSPTPDLIGAEPPHQVLDSLEPEMIVDASFPAIGISIAAVPVNSSDPILDISETAGTDMVVDNPDDPTIHSTTEVPVVQLPLPHAESLFDTDVVN
jgi:hypothetical protein